MKTLITVIAQRAFEHKYSDDVQQALIRHQIKSLEAIGWSVKKHQHIDDGHPVARGFDRGHPTTLDEREIKVGRFPWRHDDTGQRTIDAPVRACTLCRKYPTPEGHDPCIANLPGVAFACCGHGVEEGYISFNNGTLIRGHFTVVESSRSVIVNFPGSDWKGGDSGLRPAPCDENG